MLLPIKTAVQRGFTLVELLIVVIILASLAAIIVPQFTAATGYEHPHLRDALDNYTDVLEEIGLDDEEIQQRLQELDDD